MAREPLVVTIDPTSELARLLADAEEPIVLESNGAHHRVQREAEDLFADYDPERVRAALRQSRGAFEGVDVARLKRDLRERRAQDSQGRPA